MIRFQKIKDCILMLVCSWTIAAVPASAQHAVAVPANSQQEVRVETEVITVTRTEASPSQIQRKPGRFFLLLKTQDAGLNLSLVPVSGAPDASKLAGAVDVPTLQKRKKSAGLVDLPPGTYQLQIQPGGKTICTITIAE